jgi:hypothetical protein
MDLPSHINKKEKKVLIDLSDDGSMGYLFSHDPESLQEIQYTIYEILSLSFAKEGEGAFEVWSRTLDTNSHCIKIFNDPLRMLNLHAYAVTCKIYTLKTLEKSIQLLIQFLKDKQFEHVYILTSKCKSTTMGECIHKAIKSFL